MTLQPEKVLCCRSLLKAVRKISLNAANTLWQLSKNSKYLSFLRWHVIHIGRKLLTLSKRKKSNNCPYIFSRVFRSKLDDDILNKNVLDVIVAHVYVIEFQKIKLYWKIIPYGTKLLILENNYNLKEASDIDRCVWTELLDWDR